MRKTIAIAVGLLSFGSVAAFAHTLDRTPTDVTWNLTVYGDEAKLAYGRPSSDLVGLMMTCQRGDGAVTVSGDVFADKPVMVLASGERRLSLSGPMEADPHNGGHYMEARAPLHNDALDRFAETGDLAMVTDGRSTDMRASAKARGDIQRFFAHCEA
jgi:hypothetical protein